MRPWPPPTSTDIVGIARRGQVARTTNATGAKNFNFAFTPIAAGGLIANGDFETNTTGWTTQGTASIARVTTNSRYGGAALEISTGSGEVVVNCTG